MPGMACRRTLQSIVSRGFNELAPQQRADIAQLNDSLGASLAQRGLKVNHADPTPFRDALRKAGFYTDWRAKFGAQAWAALESAVGKLSPSALMGAGASTPDGPRRMASRAWADTAWRWLVEYPAALLVVAEVVILFTGIVARYALHMPITWTDEASSILFLWLSALGSAVAIQRGEHMRMTALVSKCGPQARAYLDAVAAGAALLFLALVLLPALRFADQQGAFTTPALEISGSWRAAALPAGVALMFAANGLRLMQVAGRKAALAALATVALIALAFWAGQPLFAGLGKWRSADLFPGRGRVRRYSPACPSRSASACTTFGYLALTTRVPLATMVGRMDEGMSHLVLLAVPLFIFLGLLIEMTGMARRMVAFLASLIGHKRGGLAYVLIGAMYLVSGISGAERRGYGRRGARAIPRNEKARRPGRGTWWRCWPPPRRRPKPSRPASS